MTLSSSIQSKHEVDAHRIVLVHACLPVVSLCCLCFWSSRLSLVHLVLNLLPHLPTSRRCHKKDKTRTRQRPQDNTTTRDCARHTTRQQDKTPDDSHMTPHKTRQNARSQTRPDQTRQEVRQDETDNKVRDRCVCVFVMLFIWLRALSPPLHVMDLLGE
jgi:hypothetical protein